MNANKTNGFTVVIFLLCIAATANAFASVQPEARVRPLNIALKAIRFQENSIRNIRIRAAFQGWSIKNGKTIPGTQVNSVSVYDGLPRGKFRIQVSRQVSNWTNGAGRRYLSAYIVAYNGEIGTFLQTITGTPRKRGIISDGTISGTRPARAVGYLYSDTGWAESIFGFTAVLRFEQPRFSKFLLQGQKFTTVDTRWIHWKGEKVLRVVRIGPPYGKDVFLLDPRHGYSIVRRSFYGYTISRAPDGKVLFKPGKMLRSCFQVNGFFQPSPGIFFPRQITIRNFRPGVAGEPIASGVCRINISKVSVNLLNINEGTFMVAFPRNASVRDKSTGMWINVGGTARQQQKEIRGAIAAARKVLEKARRDGH